MGVSKLKVTEQQIENLIVMNMFEVSLEKFKESYVNIGSTSHPKWTDGYLIYFSAMEDTEYHQRLQYEDKTMIWDYLEYVKMEKFSPTLKKGNLAILIQDVSDSKFFKDVAKFLKEQN